MINPYVAFAPTTIEATASPQQLMAGANEALHPARLGGYTSDRLRGIRRKSLGKKIKDGLGRRRSSGSIPARNFDAREPLEDKFCALVGLSNISYRRECRR